MFIIARNLILVVVLKPKVKLLTDTLKGYY